MNVDDEEVEGRPKPTDHHQVANDAKQCCLTYLSMFYILIIIINIIN